MPELPEVQTVVSTLTPRIVGKRIHAVQLHRTDVVTPAGVDVVSLLTGRRLESISRRGKRIIFCLDSGDCFYIHLGMSGRLTLESPDAPLLKHTHLVIEFIPDSASRKTSSIPLHLHFRDPRRFGGVFWTGTGCCDQDMGPEPLTVSPKQLHERLKGTSRAIKTALLDQHLIAGLGNIYVDEALFAAGVHPQTPAKKLTADDATRLTQAIKKILRRALRHRGSTLRDYVDAAGQRGEFQNLHCVYDRAGDPCAICKDPIRRIVLGGRSTHFCATCQARSARVKKK